MNLGNDSFLVDGGIPKPTFPLKTQINVQGKSSGLVVDVVNTTYPASWSSYLTPTSNKTRSSALDMQFVKMNSPIPAIPTFSGGAGNNVHLWISKVKLQGAQLGWNQQTLIAQACAALEGAAAMWLHTAGEEVMFKFDCFKTELVKSFMPLSRVDLLNEFFVCSQECTKVVCDFYYRLLMLGKCGGLTDPNLFTTCFWEGLHTKVQCSVELLLS